MADLGSHLLSILVSFFGGGLEILAARPSRGFQDVDPLSDLCSVSLLHDKSSGAVGTLAASRISAGAGECLELEIRCVDGGFRLSTERPDQLQLFRGDDADGRVMQCGNDYRPDSDFPALQASAGWLRSLVHAHHMFFCGGQGIPSGLRLGLQVERLVCQTAELMHQNGVATCLKS